MSVDSKRAVVTRSDLTWNVGDVQDDPAEVMQRIDRIRFTMDASGFAYQYDSAADEATHEAV